MTVHGIEIEEKINKKKSINQSFMCKYEDPVVKTGHDMSDKSYWYPVVKTGQDMSERSYRYPVVKTGRDIGEKVTGTQPCWL